MRNLRQSFSRIFLFFENTSKVWKVKEHETVNRTIKVNFITGQNERDETTQDTIVTKSAA